jgi:muramoyltetrapeptide carboxypeptidase
MTIKPPRLSAGDTVGIVTLGSPRDAYSINVGIQTLESMGFSVITGKYVYSASGYLAASPQERASDLMSMFLNPVVKAIIPVRGGVGVADLLPYLDYPAINSNPKIITGYSDITVLLNVLYQMSDMITFHSLLLIDFNQRTPAYNYDQFFAATSVAAPRRLENPSFMPMISRIPGNVTGAVVGGNLTSFMDTLGTPYEIDTRGRIVLIEETHESVSHTYRRIRHLINAGKFEDCIGILVGECSNCEDSYGKTYEDLINDVIVPLGKPLMTNLASGHGYYKLAIPIGALVNMNANSNILTVVEPAVSA